MLDRLAEASAALGDGTAAGRYGGEAQALRRLPGDADRARSSTRRRARTGRSVVEGAMRPVVVALGVIAAGLVGLAAGPAPWRPIRARRSTCCTAAAGLPIRA